MIVAPTASPEPRLQADLGGVTDTVPFWGTDVTGMRPGRPVTLTDTPAVYGYPFTRLRQLRAGDYWVQALLNVYTVFHRSDGSVVALHLPCGDGNDLFVSPGNLVSSPVRVHLDPAAGGTIDLTLTRALPQLQPVPPGGTCQQGNPPDSVHVKHIKILSRLLTRFWGHKMYLGADVLLPAGYGNPGNAGLRYPVIWNQTHFPFANPFGFTEHGTDAFSRWWLSRSAPRVIIAEIRHENPYFDDSYAVNSANLGPYGDAITKELMPAVGRAFRIINARWARTVTGGSTGGWEALAQQVYYPALYSGAWVFYPDPVDFHYFQVPDIYADPNAYLNLHAFVQVPRPAARLTSGDTIWTTAQENHWELALGDHGRSGLGQWDIWQAVYGPQGPGGYPAPIWDKVTGAIHHTVAQAWLPKDIDHYLHANWAKAGPLLTGRIHFFVGTEDTFFLNDAVQLLQQQTASLTGPRARFTFQYGLNQPHGWSPYTPQQLITIMARYMAAHASHGATSTQWLPPGAALPATPGTYQLTPPTKR
ncbi:MAG: hypothetical protein JOY82_14050 [Streptosporangiaceae bacterium]|nr:hypothetical protein [Streptosporangiaceae bacterium]MBV9855614.1 hypothetical protein [Streptosporangiaceae bacterium]